MKLSKWIIIIFLILINIFLIVPFAFCPPDPTTVSSLSVTLMDKSDGATSASTEIMFSNYDDATQTAPWVFADQFLWIEFECHRYTYWGLRIVTDNVGQLQTTYAGEVLENVLEDGSSSYAGVILINDEDDDDVEDTITDNPYYRIGLAWQVYDKNYITIAWIRLPRYWFVSPPVVADTDSDGIYEDMDIAESWCEDHDDDDGDGYADGNWAYIGDKADTEFLAREDDVLWMEDTDSDGTDDTYVYNYSLVATGCGDSIIDYVKHPGTESTTLSDEDTTDKDGDGETDDDWDIYVYLSGRLFNTSYSDSDGDGTYEPEEYFQVPAGTYKSKLYIELYYE